jgi:hypothetical protein
MLYRTEWDVTDLQEIDRICQDMENEGKRVSADSLTVYLHQCYPGWYNSVDYPYGTFASMLCQLHQVKQKVRS